MSLHLNSIINAHSNPLREVKVVEFKESIIQKWTPSRMVTVKDVVTNEMFNVREGDIKRYSKGNDVVLFVKGGL